MRTQQLNQKLWNQDDCAGACVILMEYFLSFLIKQPGRQEGSKVSGRMDEKGEKREVDVGPVWICVIEVLGMEFADCGPRRRCCC